MDLLIKALYLAGIIQFGILIASATTPQALNWKENLRVLPTLLRQMFWVYGVFIVLMIISFGTITLVFVQDLATPTPLGRAVNIVIAVFWGTRLIVQGFVFDASPWLTKPIYRIGYHGLTASFIYLTIIYTWAAL
jgi:hypothetical protein